MEQGPDGGEEDGGGEGGGEGTAGCCDWGWGREEVVAMVVVVVGGGWERRWERMVGMEGYGGGDGGWSRLLRDGGTDVEFFYRLCRSWRGRRIGGFVGLEALLVACMLLADGALGYGWEDDEGVDFRGMRAGRHAYGSFWRTRLAVPSILSTAAWFAGGWG